MFLILIIILFVFFKFKFSININYFTIILALSLLNPEIFKYPNKLWMKFGLILSKILNPLIYTLLYFVAVGLTKLFLDLFNKKLIKNQIHKLILIGLKEMMIYIKTLIINF